jgi:hypothetical protein
MAGSEYPSCSHEIMKKLFWPRPRYLVALPIALGAILLITYSITVNGELYSFAEDFVERDERISKVVGRQAGRSLYWRDGFSFSFGDTSGEGGLTVKVAGERGDFKVPLELKKREGRWSVLSARVVNERGDVVAILIEPELK